jgi:hypothetical protein
VPGAISRTTSIEELVNGYPGVVKYLIEKSLPCIMCGEPAWGSLEEFARDHGYSEADIDSLVDDLKRAFAQSTQ